MLMSVRIPRPAAPTPSAPTVSAHSSAPVSLDTSCGQQARAAQTLMSVNTRTGVRIKGDMCTIFGSDGRSGGAKLYIWTLEHA